VRRQNQVYASLLSTYEQHLISEIIAPPGTEFRYALEAGGHVYFVLDDGRIASVPQDALTRNAENGGASSKVADAIGAPFDTKGWGISPGLAWEWQGSVFLLPDYDRTLLRAGGASNWTWAPIGESLLPNRGSIDQVVVDRNGGAALLFFREHGVAGFYRTDLRSGRIEPGPVVSSPAPILEGEELIRLWRWAGHDSEFAYEYVIEDAAGSITSPAAGVLYRWSLSGKHARELVFRLQQPQPIPAGLTLCQRDGGFAGVSVDKQGRATTVVHFDALGRVTAQGTVPTIAGLTSPITDGDWESGFNPGPPQAIFTLKGSHRLVFQLVANGLCVVDLDTMNLTMWEWLADASRIGLEIGESGMILTDLAGSERSGVWDTGGKEGLRW